jgi:hypothetical protein
VRSLRTDRQSTRPARRPARSLEFKEVTPADIPAEVKKTLFGQLCHELLSRLQSQHDGPAGDVFGREAVRAEQISDRVCPNGILHARAPPRQRPREGSLGCRAKRTPPETERGNKPCRDKRHEQGRSAIRIPFIITLDPAFSSFRSHHRNRHCMKLVDPCSCRCRGTDCSRVPLSGGVRFARHPRLLSHGRVAAGAQSRTTPDHR